MASVQDKIAESLEVLKQYQDSHTNLVIQGRNEIGETHMRRLLQHGYLIPVLKGWYIPSFPGREGDTSVWYSSYWAFIASYANSRFGKDWCLTAEQSLSYYAGETASPSQIVIRARNASNSITPLLYGDSMLSIAASLPEKNPLDWERKNALAARGYYQAFIVAEDIFEKYSPWSVANARQDKRGV